jgi:hypothetical protein
MAVRLLLAICLGISGAWVSAREVSLPEQIAVPQGFRIGMEIELSLPALARIISMFDFNRFQDEVDHFGGPKVLIRNREFYSDYLLSERAYYSLPVEVRRQLTQGLQLSEAELFKPTRAEELRLQNERTGRILGPNGQPLGSNTGSRIVLPNTSVPQSRGIQKPEVKNPEHQRVLGEVEKENELRKVFDRWKALGFDEQSKYVRWEFLGNDKKAALAQSSDAFEQLKLRADLPQETKTFMAKFDWHLDPAGAAEFKHRDAHLVTDPVEFLEDVKKFSSYAGITDQIFNPETAQKDTSSFHYHMSVKGKPLRPVVQLMNLRALVDRLDLGWDKALEPHVRSGFKAVEEKGLYRLVRPDRLESRAHQEPLLQELPRNIRLVSLPEEESVKELSDHILSKLTPERMDQILDPKNQKAFALLPIADRIVPREPYTDEILGLRILQKAGVMSGGKVSFGELNSAEWAQLRKALQGFPADELLSILTKLMSDDPPNWVLESAEKGFARAFLNQELEIASQLDKLLKTHAKRYGDVLHYFGNERDSAITKVLLERLPGRGAFPNNQYPMDVVLFLRRVSNSREESGEIRQKAKTILGNLLNRPACIGEYMELSRF